MDTRADSQPYRIAIFASGNGSNAEQIILYFSQHPQIKVSLLLSNNPDAAALQRAARHGVETINFDRHQFRESEIVLKWLREREVTHVVLAGFMWLVPAYLIKAYTDRMVNIHPALLPKFGGKGMYGMKVHEAVKLQNETASGISIHVVNEHYDEGAILFQCSCALTRDDTAEDIARKVQLLEHKFYPRVIEDWILQRKIRTDLT